MLSSNISVNYLIYFPFFLPLVSTVVTTDSNVQENFIVSHLQNTMVIKYNTNGWLRRVREHPTTKAAYGILTESAK